MEARIRIQTDGEFPPSPPDGIPSPSKDTPCRYTVEEAYPNPFNPVTSIRYQLPEDSHIRVNIVNALGQEIALLKDGTEMAGYHCINWNASTYPSGVYYSRFQATSIKNPTKMFTKIMKMVFIK